MPTPPPEAESRARRTLILIPACNEAERIGKVVDGARAASPIGTHIVVVDDGSRDDTAAVAAAHGADTIRHRFNLGYGAALQTGYRYALRHGFDRVVQMDGDGQHAPESIQTLLDGLAEGADVVVGSRYQGSDAPKTSFLRRIGSKTFAWIVTKWTGVSITDPTSGFQAMTRRAVHEVARDSFPEDYPDADVLIALHRAGLRLREKPVVMHERLGGVSMHRGSRAAFYGYKMFFSLALLPIRRSSPFREGRRPLSLPSS